MVYHLAMSVSVIIPAAGASTRFGEQNKLDQDLGGRTVLQRTVELFANHPRVDQIVVAGPNHEPGAFDEFRLRYADRLGLLGCTVCPGGTTHRWQTVKAALEHVDDSATVIAVHDAARPCTPTELLDRLLAAVLDHGHPAVIPGSPLTDTIKQVSAQAAAETPEDPLDAILGGAGKPDLAARAVERTLDRSQLVAIQTPQVFKADLLRRAYQQDDLTSTDDAGLVERLGETVLVLESDPSNLKITHPRDLDLARLVLGLKQAEDARRAAHQRF